MKVFKVKAIGGKEYEVEGTHYSMMKYLHIYKDDAVVFTLRTNKVLSVQ